MDADQNDKPSPSSWGQRPLDPPAEARPAVALQPRSPFTMRLLIIAGVLAAVIATVALLAPETLWQGSKSERLVYLLVMGAVLVLQAARSKISLGTLGKYAGAWGVVLAVLLAGYSYRDTFRDIGRRIAGDLMPSLGVATDADTISFARSSDGHFWIDAKVEGISIRFLVDTGASAVVLSRDDAKRLGFDLSKLTYSWQFSTANGTVGGAPVELRDIAIGPLAFRNIGAVVNEAPMRESVLGMHLLEQFSRIEMTRDTLTIRR